jgi:coproporphyrinogen III oxidase-like Fe-S oxidoreductase|tara:strand:+ start:4121 stop:4447 length:327 start_codon:yes stop_codon:yes gene_type:complete
MLENFSIFNILDSSYKNNKTISIEIYNVEEFDQLKFDLIKILYYNKISYNLKNFKNKVILTLNLDTNKNNIIFYKFNLDDLFKILNLNIDNSNEYLLHISKNLSNIKY